MGRAGLLSDEERRHITLPYVQHAVVLLHGCAGIFPTIEGAWAERFSSWGYVALVVDSFRTRGIKDTCMSSLPDRQYDPYGALDYLASLPFVDAKRIALVGFSAGGLATLQALQLGGAEVLMARKFKAAAVFYPPCAHPSGNVVAPTLILVGELDDWTPAKDCRQLMDLGSANEKRGNRGAMFLQRSRLAP
jgi:dienelactone hydrolase